MDLHSFRIIGSQLGMLLDGARVEKIHSPLSSVYTFSIFSRGKKLRLVIRYERRQPLLFFSNRKLENPQQPPAKAMLLRKYAGGRRIGHGKIDLANRALAFPIHSYAFDETPDGEKTVRYLILDMVSGPDIVSALPEGFQQPLVWPDFEIVDALCEPSASRNNTEAVWQQFSVLSPLLRDSLSHMESMDGRALLVDLESGEGDLFFYKDADGRPAFYNAWPLPDAVLRKRGLVPCSIEDILRSSANPLEGSFPGGLSQEEYLAFSSLLAVSIIDEARFFADVSNLVRKEALAPEKKKEKKLARLRAKLDQEETRLTGMKDLRKKALMLQQVLWQYPSEARLTDIRVEEDGKTERVELNPLLSVRENMAFMFKQSSRGMRGLAMLEQRKAALDADETEVWPVKQAQSDPRAKEKAGISSKQGKGAERKRDSYHEKDVARFTSGDGFVIFRGKNAKGNLALFKLGKGHDLWLHVEGGPGAHVIIRRAHEAEIIPRKTILEAARLAAEKSWQGQISGAGIMVALLRHVHPLKGAAPGAVRIDSLQESIILP